MRKRWAAWHKLRFFLAGTSRGQPARPVPIPVNEQQLAEEIAADVARQFEEARTGKRLRLDLRPFLRKKRKEIAEAMAAAIAAAPPKKRPDGRPTGGSLSRARGVARAIGVKTAQIWVKAGAKYGVQVSVQGIRRVEQELRDVAVRRLRSEKSGADLLRDMEALKRRAVELQREARRAREAARSA